MGIGLVVRQDIATWLRLEEQRVCQVLVDCPAHDPVILRQQGSDSFHNWGCVTDIDAQSTAILSMVDNPSMG